LGENSARAKEASYDAMAAVLRIRADCPLIAICDPDGEKLHLIPSKFRHTSSTKPPNDLM
jgi:hypothetical protein